MVAISQPRCSHRSSSTRHGVSGARGRTGGGSWPSHQDFAPCGFSREREEPLMTTRANKTDAGNGSYGICRVIDASRSPSPDPKRSASRAPSDERSVFHVLLETNHLHCHAFQTDHFRARSHDHWCAFDRSHILRFGFLWIFNRRSIALHWRRHPPSLRVDRRTPCSTALLPSAMSMSHASTTNAEQNGCRQRLVWHLSCHRRLPLAVA